MKTSVRTALAGAFVFVFPQALLGTCLVASVLALAFVGCTRRAEPERGTAPVLPGSASASLSQKTGIADPPSPRASSSSAALASAVRPDAAPSAADARCITPESVGVERLLATKGGSADETAALGAARAELQRLLQVPSEFYVSVQAVGELVLLELWHESAFARENCGKTGNPGEKSRTLAYDVHKRRITSSKIWQ